MKRVLFASDRPLERAENLKAVWDAFDGPKEFVQYMVKACASLCDEYSVFVCDEIPQYSPTKGNVMTVFVSHGMTGDKLYGLDCSESHRLGAGQVDYAVCTTDYSKKRVMGQLGLPKERVLKLGMPITDNYIGKRKGDGSTVLAEYGSAYLYAPTWRAKGNPPLPRIDWRKLDLLMEDGEMIAVKRHMCTGKPLVGEELHHVTEIANTAPSVPYLIDCDVLATDFSSILFDGYVLGKPSVLVTDGAEEYQDAHGMYEPYPRWYGSKWCRAEGSEEAFLSLLRMAKDDGMCETERKCLSLTAGECDGHAAERVADLVRSLM